MPGLLDKVLLNQESTMGDHAAIKRRYNSLVMLAGEIKELDLLAEAEPIKEKMMKLCDDHGKADRKYLAGLDECVKEMAALIDGKVIAKP